MGDAIRATLGVRAALALLLGLVSAAMVVLGAIMPRTTSAVVLVIFGGYALLDGLVAVFASRAAAASRGLLALEPLVGIAAGIAAAVLVRQSNDLPAVLRALIGGWAIVMGVVQVIEAGVLPLQRGRPLLGAIGALSLLLGCLLLASPPSEQTTLIWRLAIYGIVLGILRLIFSFRLVDRAGA